jgi:hypothetical protein
MRSLTKSFCLLACVVASTAASGEQWFAVQSPGAESARTAVEVDLDSIRARGQVGETVIRITYESPQQHPSNFVFRSVVATAQFDCQRRTISLISGAYFAAPQGNGLRLGAESAGHASGMPELLLRSIPAPTLHALLRATCATTQTS